MTEEKEKKTKTSWGEPPHFCSVCGKPGHWSGWELHGPQALCWWHDLLQFTDTLSNLGICSHNSFNISSFYRFLDKSFFNSFTFFRMEKSMEIFEINLSR